MKASRSESCPVAAQSVNHNVQGTNGAVESQSPTQPLSNPPQPVPVAQASNNSTDAVRQRVMDA
eukprot:CAMPEP_0174853694 /NCGR_PEP_ID=MMETSP1114-20130205/29522_1 /TAXON_ID=312471 /ORGANISM="Neobodo designis, Strain CCAP 1951/1" /LENGTH=63 /DNA_ID=CAMNT_0016088355 /DNA_START=35 /DNA_END=223 /DNA_ORIENTATION=+